METKRELKKKGILYLLLLTTLIIGSCHVKSDHNDSDTNMTTNTDTAAPVTHMQLPEANPLAIVTQFIGMTELRVRYNRPSLYSDSDSVSSRIPIDRIWSPGYHQVSKFYTSDTIMIKDKKIPAGSYSLLMIPGDKQWVIVLNTDTLYDIQQYDEKSDVVRIPIDIKNVPFTKNLTFSFSELQPNATVLSLNWGTTSIRLPIAIHDDKQIIQSFETAFTKADKNDWHIYMQAADYCLQTGKEIDKGIEWINKSIEIKENHSNTWAKAELFAAKREYKKAVEFGEKAMELGKTSPNETRQKHFENRIDMWKHKSNKKSK